MQTLNVVWTCGQGEACTNTRTPGEHRGDYGHDEGLWCMSGIVYHPPVLDREFYTVEPTPPAPAAAVEQRYIHTYER